MRNVVLLAALCGLAACATNGQLSPQSQAAVAKVCAQDTKLQPVAVADLAEIQTVAAVAAVAGVAVPAAAVVSNDVGQAVSVDQSLIHPFVVEVCAQLAPAS